MNEINVALTLNDIYDLLGALSVAGQECQISDEVGEALTIKLKAAEERLLNNG